MAVAVDEKPYGESKCGVLFAVRRYKARRIRVATARSALQARFKRGDAAAVEDTLSSDAC
jgi:hypothetical protein